MGGHGSKQGGAARATGQPDDAVTAEQGAALATGQLDDAVAPEQGVVPTLATVFAAADAQPSGSRSSASRSHVHGSGTELAASDAEPSSHRHRDLLHAPHLEPVASGLHLGHKLSSVVSFASMGDEVVRPLTTARNALKSVHSRMDLLQEFHAREMAAAAFKRDQALDWLPEYHPVSVVPPSRGALTNLERVTRVSQACITNDVPVGRKTKVVCTLGPGCWSEEGLAGLLDAGMDVARFNFSHGTHATHQEVLDRLRKVAAAKKSHVAFLLDTKGPEIRTAMLRGGKDITLEAGQEVTVVAAGEDYVKWEGFKDEATGETKIGLSYARLCQSMKPGGIILIADGAISIEVVRILNDTELLGRGPEVRTTNLRGHTPLQLGAGQTVVLVPTPDPLFEGYTEKEAASEAGEGAVVHYVGIAYPSLAAKLRVGDVLLLNEGAISISVKEVQTGMVDTGLAGATGAPAFLNGRVLAEVTSPGKLLEDRAVDVAGGSLLQFVAPCSGYTGTDTIAYRSTKVGLDLVTGPTDVRQRKTKVICTLGPKCWSEEGLGMLVDNGMNVARFNFSHGSHADHQAVLDRLRDVLVAKGAEHRVALMLDTKGPEVRVVIRTAMLRGGKDISLEAGQELTVVAVGEDYIKWEGFKDEATGETKIGLSYAHLCRDVKVGGMIKIGDGQITLEVLEITSPTELRARALNSKTLGQRKNCNLPGVHVELPVLGPNDVRDVQQFAVKNKMDFVAASFVQSADDVNFIRRTLDEVGGQGVRIISKIESTAGLVNYDAILAATDGIMVARGDLAMEIPSEKVALAQKMMITKANIAGKFVVTATQMLESMTSAPLPTRAEMTDVANAVFDGTDAVMLSGETANGAFPELALSTMAAIAANAEVGTNYPQVYDFIRDFSARPMSTAEAVLGCAAKNVLDVDAALILVISSTGESARLVSKYRPRVPVLLVTDSLAAARSCAPSFGILVSIVEQLPESRFD
ncbi:Pyruvate kinase, partial [Tetrabaena socialis]